MKKGFIIFIAIAGIFIPTILIPLASFLLEFFARGMPKLPVSLVLDFSESMTSGEYIALYFSILGVIATITLAYLIYRLERSNEKRAEQEEIKRVKRTLMVLLHNGINRAIKSQKDDEWVVFDFIRVTDNHIGMVASIGHLLSEEQFLYLNQIMETLKDIAENEKNGDTGDAKISVERLMRLITIPVYPMYRFYMKNLKSISDVMSVEALQIFSILSDNEKTFSNGIRYNSMGNKLFDCSPDNRYKVYDDSENVICDATVDNNGIIEGKAKIFHEDGFLEFEGSFIDGKRCGRGVEYLSNGRKGKDGEWQADQLINGIIYDVKLDASGKVFTDTIQQIENSSDLYDLEKYSSELKVGNIRIINGQMKVVKESVKKAVDFLEFVVG